MKKITPQTEEKLLSVIEKTAKLVSDGLTPNDAIVKAARDGNLRPGEIDLVVHAYNTGRTTRQRQDGKDPFEKSADFELADATEVNKILYPETVKTASQVAYDTAISDEYSYSPKDLLARKYKQEKLAEVKVDWRIMDGQEITAPEPYRQDPKERAKTAMAYVDRLRRSTEECRRKMANAFDELGNHFMELSTYFQRPDAKPLPVVKEAVILMHGDQGEKIMDELVQVSPFLQKLANHRTGSSLIGPVSRSEFSVTVDDLDCTEEPFDKVAAIISGIANFQQLRREFQTAEELFNKQASETLAPFASPAVSPSILGTSSDEREKSAFGVPDPLKALGTYSLVKNTMGGIADKLKPADTGKQVSNVVSELNDPDHEAELRKINTQAMLQDLMINDPVIAGYPADEVASAFNDLVQVSPSVADQRMIIQSLLRKQLQQGQLDTFEQDQLLGFEDKLRKQTAPVKGTGDASII